MIIDCNTAFNKALASFTFNDFKERTHGKSTKFNIFVHFKNYQAGLPPFNFYSVKKKVWNTKAAYVSNYHFNFSDSILILKVCLYKKRLQWLLKCSKVTNLFIENDQFQDVSRKCSNLQLN